jgi:hypothetical protein
LGDQSKKEVSGKGSMIEGGAPKKPAGSGSSLGKGGFDGFEFA